MARKKYWIGSTGPFFYDDEQPVNDPDGIESISQSGIVAPSVKVQNAPVTEYDVVRRGDVVGGSVPHAGTHVLGGTDPLHHDLLVGYDPNKHVSHAAGLTTTWTVAVGDVVTITNGLITGIS